MRGDREASSKTRITAKNVVVSSITFAVRHHLALSENKATVIEIMNPRRATAEMAAAMDSIVSMNRTSTLPIASDAYSKSFRLLQAQNGGDEKAIRDMLNEEVRTWNAGDAVGYSRHFTDDCTFTNNSWHVFQGAESLRAKACKDLIGEKGLLKQLTKALVEIFHGEFRGTALKQEVVSIKFVRPEVAIVETLTTVSNFPGPVPAGVHADENGAIHTRLLQVFIKSRDDWKIATYHNVDVKETPPK
jgi:uncharacterized protein (TIGR02246 family)